MTERQQLISELRLRYKGEALVQRAATEIETLESQLEDTLKGPCSKGDYIDREPVLQKAKEVQGNTFGVPLIVRAIEQAPVENVAPVEEVVSKIRVSIKENMFNPNNKFDFIYDEIFDVLDKVLEEYNGKKDT